MQYKVDGDEELHNPAEESTTFCPLLPGQRLNVLDMPREGHSRSNSETNAAFTRNPNDRYLTPVPPAPPSSHPSSRKGGVPEPHTNPLPSPWTPRSATHSPTDYFLSPHVVRHARSASASPCIPSTPLFADFKALKDKLASKRATSRSRCGSKTRELDISSPVLVSGGEDLNLIPLSVYRPSVESIRETQSENTPQRSLPSLRREFSPLASHPVDPDLDSVFGPAELPAIEERPTRRRSYVPSTVLTSDFRVEQSRLRANSADTRRTRHFVFSNDPWLSSPKVPQDPQEDDKVVEDDTPSAPTLSRPLSSLGGPASDERPTSSHGNRGNTTFRKSLLDKELPALPSYLIPAPLYAYNRTETNELPAEEPENEFEEPEDEFEEPDDDERMDYMSMQFQHMQFEQKARSHFSTWSTDSIAYSSPISETNDDEVVFSPTLSSLTSNDSDMDTSQGLLIRYSYAAPQDAAATDPSSHRLISPPVPEIQHTTMTDDEADEAEDSDSPYRLSTPPQLDELRISTFGSDLFSSSSESPPAEPFFSDTSSRRSSRRQAACFGLGFQYSLPADETASKTTLTDEEAHAGRIMHQRSISVHRENAMSRLDALMEDFAFLGDAVV